MTRRSTIQLGRLVSSAGILLGLAAAGCSREPVPARSALPAPMAPPAATVAEQQPRPGVTNAQQAPGAGAASAPDDPSLQEASPVNNLALNTAPPAYGATELQPDIRTRAAQVIALASQQIDRLQRVENGMHENHKPARLDIESALADIEGQRERVLQDLRALELQPASRSANVQMQLANDLADLRHALADSYFVVPEPSRGMPQPSPLPPAELP